MDAAIAPCRLPHRHRRRIFSLAASLVWTGLAFAESGGAARLDMTGRAVSVPSRIERVFCTTPVGSAMVYSLAPEKLISWNFSLEEADMAYIPQQYRKLPAFGGSAGAFNTEEIIRSAPDLIVDFEGAGQASVAMRLSEESGVPLVRCLNGIDDIPASYRFLGRILGKAERGDRIASYIEGRLARLKSALASIPREELARTYYAESPDGLATDGADSIHTQLMEYVRAVNVVTEKSGKAMRGLNVSLEQVLSWNPQVIIASRHLGGDRFAASVRSDPDWLKIDAVRNGRVYLAPSGPFDWFDRPPCMMRALGAMWLAQILYPAYLSIDIRAETREFYALVLDRSLNDEELDRLLRGGGGSDAAR